MLVTLIGISIIIFVLLRVVPGNIVDILFDAAGFVDPADKANLEKELGLNQPLVVQYLHWIGGLRPPPSPTRGEGKETHPPLSALPDYLSIHTSS